MKQPARRCGTCRHADWARAGVKGPGDCRFPVTMPALPFAITASISFRPTFSRNAIWGQDGADCPTWELKS